MLIDTSSELDLESPAVSVENAFGALRGVDEWNQRDKSHAHDGNSIVDEQVEVEGYTEDGLYIAGEQDIITLDVDDTLPGLQPWSDPSEERQ